MIGKLRRLELAEDEVARLASKSLQSTKGKDLLELDGAASDESNPSLVTESLRLLTGVVSSPSFWNCSLLSIPESIHSLSLLVLNAETRAQNQGTKYPKSGRNEGRQAVIR